MCTAQRGREEANRFEEGRVEAGYSAEDGVSQQLCRGQPGRRRNDIFVFNK